MRAARRGRWCPVWFHLGDFPQQVKLTLMMAGRTAGASDSAEGEHGLGQFMKELSGLMEMFPLLTEVCATRVHIFAKIHLTVRVRPVHFTAHQMSFKKEKREQSRRIQNNKMYLQEHKKHP